MIRCECSNGYFGVYNVSCHYIDNCPTCNEDGTICGTTESFNLTLYRLELNSVHSIFRYHQAVRGTSSPVTVEIHDSVFLNGSFVAVNGQECTHTYTVTCQDGFRGYEIDCTNVVLLNNDNNETVEDLLTYDSCSFDLNGGVFDVFGWMAWELYSGCPFRFKIDDYPL